MTPFFNVNFPLKCNVQTVKCSCPQCPQLEGYSQGATAMEPEQEHDQHKVPRELTPVITPPQAYSGLNGISPKFTCPEITECDHMWKLEGGSIQVGKAGVGQTCKALGTFQEVDLCLKHNSHCIMSFKYCSWHLVHICSSQAQKWWRTNRAHALWPMPMVAPQTHSPASLGHGSPVAHTPA